MAFGYTQLPERWCTTYTSHFVGVGWGAYDIYLLVHYILLTFVRISSRHHVGNLCGQDLGSPNP